MLWFDTKICLEMKDLPLSAAGPIGQSSPLGEPFVGPDSAQLLPVLSAASFLPFPATVVSPTVPSANLCLSLASQRATCRLAALITYLKTRK